jgi:predicted alpha/beta-hydrolase family hydrolase
VWAVLGALAMIAFAWTFQAHGVDSDVTESDDRVRVTDHAHHIEFAPVGGAAQARLVFFPGGMVQPEAYAPVARAVAERGYEVVLVRLPFLGRHAPGESHKREALRRAEEVLRDAGDGVRRVVAGHSFGGVLASRLVAENPALIDGLVLIATTHPRDVDLSATRVHITKVLGTRDGVASIEKARANARLLPDDVRWVEIEGANHAQFGHYGPQLGDGRATLSRAEQQSRLVDLLIEELSGRDTTSGRAVPPRGPLDLHAHAPVPLLLRSCADPDDTASVGEPAGDCVRAASGALAHLFGIFALL